MPKDKWALKVFDFQMYGHLVHGSLYSYVNESKYVLRTIFSLQNLYMKASLCIRTLLQNPETEMRAPPTFLRTCVRVVFV